MTAKNHYPIDMDAARVIDMDNPAAISRFELVQGSFLQLLG